MNRNNKSYAFAHVSALALTAASVYHDRQATGRVLRPERVALSVAYNVAGLILVAVGR